MLFLLISPGLLNHLKFIKVFNDFSFIRLCFLILKPNFREVFAILLSKGCEYLLYRRFLLAKFLFRSLISFKLRYFTMRSKISYDSLSNIMNQGHLHAFRVVYVLYVAKIYCEHRYFR